MKSFIVENFDLDETILSGQFFNFKDLGNSTYIIGNRSEVFKIQQVENILYYENIEKYELKEFLGLNFNIDLLENFEDNYFQKAFLKYSKGLRIMKPDLFQTIISFVCSAASHQKKIETNIRGIAEKFGEYHEEYDFYSFPNPEDINNLDTLLSCKVGYRGKYILQICFKLSEDKDLLERIQCAVYSDAHQLLMTLPGIGSKVADCICLFALKHYQAFPVDTWIKKMLISWYGFNGSQREMENFAQKTFGDLGGYYQQYLFHLLRDEGL